MASLLTGLWALVLRWTLAVGASGATMPPGIQIGPVLASRNVPAHSGTWTASFTIYNSTATAKVVSLSCGGTMASCAPSASSIAVASHETESVEVTFTTNGTDPYGELSLLGSASGTTSGSSPMNVDVGPSMVRMVAPGPDASAIQTVHRSRPVLRTEFVLPAGEETDTNSIQLWWKGQLIPLGALRRNARMLEWEIPADRALAVGESASYKVRHCLVSATCTEETRIVVLPADLAPVIDFTGMPFEGPGRGLGLRHTCRGERRGAPRWRTPPGPPIPGRWSRPISPFPGRPGPRIRSGWISSMEGSGRTP